MNFTIDSKNIFTLDPSHLPSLLLFVSLGLTILVWLQNKIFPLPALPESATSPPTVHALSLSPDHNFSKSPARSVHLVKDLGIQNDAHSGTTVQHRSRLHIQPPPANLRQVHLIQNETLEKLDLQPGEIGDNITTVGIDLLHLGKGTKLRFVDAGAVDAYTKQKQTAGIVGELVVLADGNGIDTESVPTLTVTGLRNPCPQIHAHRPGLQEEFIERDENRNIIARKAGIMSTVDVGGEMKVGMRILVEEPKVWEKLEVV